MSSAHTHPFYLPQSAVLLAKTCPGCGLLLGAGCFRRYAGHWKTNCNVCDDSRERHRIDHRRTDFNERCQQASLPAPNHRKPWDEEDHAVLADATLTALEKALTLGRTFYATKLACSRWRYPSKTIPKATNDGGAWVIELPARRMGVA